MDWLANLIKILEGPRRDVSYQDRTPGQAMWDQKTNIMKDVSRDVLSESYDLLTPWDTRAEQEQRELIGDPRKKDPRQEFAQASIAAREKQESKVSKRRKMLEEAAAQDKWVRSTGLDSVYAGSQPDKGVLIGGLDPEQIKRIRAQAASASGRAAGTPTQAQIDAQSGDELIDAQGNRAGGWVESTTPEIALQRQKENADWAADQWLRDIRHDLTRRGGMGEQAPSSAGYALAQLSQAEQMQNQQRNTMELVKSLSGMSGKIPFEQAQSLALQGVDVPMGMIGASKEEVTGLISDGLRLASQAANNIDNPAEQKAGKFLAIQLMKLQQQMDNGMINPEDAKMRIQRLISEAHAGSAEGAMIPTAEEAIEEALRPKGIAKLERGA